MTRSSRVSESSFVKESMAKSTTPEEIAAILDAEKAKNEESDSEEE